MCFQFADILKNCTHINRKLKTVNTKHTVMLPIAYYLLKVMICSGILLGYYWLALRNKIFHHYNRFYLLAVVVLSLAVPVIKISFWEKDMVEKPAVIKVLQAVSDSDLYLDNIIVSNTTEHWYTPQWDAAQWAGAGYSVVSLIMLLLLFHTLFTIYRLLRKYPKQQIGSISFVNTEAKSTPFSFFNYIFWNRHIDTESPTGKQIFQHEVAHIQEKHTHDKIFMNLVLAIFWCNPFFWLIRRELNMIHEFIADKKAVEDSDTAAFAAMILQATYPQHRFQLTNNFFYSPIKRRLAMLVKNNTSKVTYFGRLLVLPLAILVFAAFTFKTKKSTGGYGYSGEKITVAIEAGHGGKDHGTKSADGILEKDLVLAIAKKIKELNGNESIDIVLVREDDRYMDPAQKAAFAKEKGADILISLHTDGTALPDQKTGMQVLVARDQFENAAASKQLAAALIETFGNNYMLPVAPQPKQRTGGIWILQANNIPSVLIEAGVITNRADADYVKSNAAQETIARNILRAIENYASANFTSGKPTGALAYPFSENGIAQLFDTTRKPKKQYIKTSINNNTCLISADTVIFENSLKREIESAAKMEKLVIVNGKEFDCRPYTNLRIVAKMVKGYGQNNKEAISKYGSKANNGVLEFYDAVVEEPVGVSNIQLAEVAEKYDEKALVVIDGKETGNNGYGLTKVDEKAIDHIYVLKDKQAIEKYGVKGANGVIEIYTKKEQGLPDNVLYVVDNLVRDKSYLDNITPEQISSINVVKDESAVKKYGEKAKNGVLEVTTKKQTDPLKEVVVTGYPTTRVREYNTINDDAPAAIALDKMNVLYIGVDNPITAAAPGVAPEDLVLTVTEGNASITGKNGKYNIRVTSPGQVTIGVMKSGSSKIISQSSFRVRRIPDPANGEAPAEYDIKIDKLPSQQQWQKAAGKEYPDTIELRKDNRIFTKVETEASFAGGNEAWRKYLLNNLDPSIPTKEGWKTGNYTVLMQFVVRTDGTVTDIVATTHAGTKTAQHCIELIKKAGRWKPAIQNGHAVNSYRKQPLTFSLN